ncbi:hypothetical protein L9F63_010750, partial [Diploptera punctata]
MSDLEDFDHVFGIRGEEEFDRVYQRIQLEEQENRRNIARRRRVCIRYYLRDASINAFLYSRRNNGSGLSLRILGYVEVVDMKVTVCRDAVKGKCVRPLCKYYHIPIPLPPANEMAAHQGQGCDKTYLDVSLTNLDFSGTSSPRYRARPDGRRQRQ